MKYKANIIVFLAALALLVAVVFIMPPDPGAGDFENRAMSPMPQLSVSSFFDGSFFKGIDDYMSDATAYRTSMLQFASDFERSFGIGVPGSATLADVSTEDLGLGIIPEVEDEDLLIELPE
ncbi:MAG: DHHW family protein, partial [Oscillospiraceae bacterium]|nr:DHHW family protein [Oscillospiraceae bacterium]